MNIVTLVEDTHKNPDLGYEHGVSFYIETFNHKLLFDVGQSDLFIKNAERLAIDLRDVDTVIISHGHYDHGGGLPYFLNLNSKAMIYLQKSAFNEFYSMRKENEFTYIGLDKNLDLSRFVLLEGDHIIDDELMIINQIEGHTFFPNSNHSMYKIHDHQFVLDDFTHEQSLIVHSDKTYALFAGCAHKGIVNIINQAETVLMNHSLDVVFGGFHLTSRFQEYEESKESIQAIANLLVSKKISTYYTGHCTGSVAFSLMKPILQDRLAQFYPGLIVTL